MKKYNQNIYTMYEEESEKNTLLSKENSTLKLENTNLKYEFDYLKKSTAKLRNMNPFLCIKAIFQGQVLFA